MVEVFCFVVCVWPGKFPLRMVLTGIPLRHRGLHKCANIQKFSNDHGPGQSYFGLDQLFFKTPGGVPPPTHRSPTPGGWGRGDKVFGGQIWGQKKFCHFAPKKAKNGQKLPLAGDPQNPWGYPPGGGGPAHPPTQPHPCGPKV